MISQTEQELTGYPSIDKPWLKYYKRDKSKFRHESMYECLINSNIDNMQSTALQYFGNKISYREMQKMIDNYAEGIKSLGVKPDDRVIVLGLNTPEIICSIYAINKIGAIACLEYVTSNDIQLSKIVKEYNAKLAIVIDTVYEKFAETLFSSGITNILLTRTFSSMPFPLNFFSRKKFCILKKDKRTIDISEFNCLNCENQGDAIGKPENVAVIIATSGTTGIPKRAELTNEAINALAFQGKYCDVGMETGTKMLTPAPPFLAFGISLTVHMPLCNGVCLILSVSPDPEFVAKQFFRYKPNLFIGAHIFCDRILEKAEKTNRNLCFLKAIELGGEKIEPDYKDRIESQFRNRGFKGNLFSGYGMTELAACSTTESKFAIRRGSVGIPLCFVNMKIVDDAGRELKYGDEGEIMVCSPCMMKGYFNDDEATQKMICKDVNGERWIHTGDLGSIDKDGFIYVSGRIKRIEVTKVPDSNMQVKLFPDYIEYLLDQCEYVKQCAVIVIDDKNRDRVPVAYVKCDKENLKEIIAYMTKTTANYNWPVEYRIVDEIPLRPNGKIDYKKLEELDRENNNQILK